MVDLTNIIGVEGIHARPKQKRKTMRELYAEMADAGLVITTVITDGVIKRVPTKDRPNKTNGWYIAREIADNHVVCSFGNWADPTNHTFNWSTFADKTEAKKYESEMRSAWEQLKTEERRLTREAHVKALESYDKATDNVIIHPYLVAKGIDSSPGMRLDNGHLLVPLHDLMNNFVGIQFIGADGGKKFSFKSKPASGFYFFGTNHEAVKGERRLIIAEGVATGASLYKATGVPVAVIWSANFALKSCKALREVTDAQFLVCLDNDENSVGQTAAQKIAEEIPNCKNRVPSFAGLDYNDVELQHGPQVIRREVLKETFGLRGRSVRMFQEQPKPRDWAIENFVETGKAGIMAGVGGIGKSMEALRLSLMIAEGKGDWLGHSIARSGNVVYISAEDDEQEMHRRVHAIDPTNKRADFLHDVYFVTVPELGRPISFLEGDKAGYALTSAAQDLEDELATVEDLEMVIIDPVQAFVNAPISNDNEAAQIYATWASGIASRLGCVVMSVHHMSKVALTGVESATEARAAIRGATSIVDGHRFAIALWNASTAKVADCCTQYGLFPPDPNRVAHVAMVKSNSGEVDRTVKTVFRRDAVFEVVVDNTIEPSKPADDGTWTR